MQVVFKAGFTVLTLQHMQDGYFHIVNLIDVSRVESALTSLLFLGFAS